jgi:ketosteroid isomerase-like protein
MPPEHLIRAAYDAMNADDLEALLALMDPGVEIRSEAVRAPGGGEWFRGYVGVREWWNAMRDTYDRARFELRELHVDGDRAVAELTGRFEVNDELVEVVGWQSARFHKERLLMWARYRTEREARASVGM